MNYNNRLKLGKIIISFLIIIIFVYAINVQPKVFGDSNYDKNFVLLGSNSNQSNGSENPRLSSNSDVVDSFYLMSIVQSISIRMNNMNNLGALRDFCRINLR